MADSLESTEILNLRLERLLPLIFHPHNLIVFLFTSIPVWLKWLSLEFYTLVCLFVCFLRQWAKDCKMTDCSHLSYFSVMKRYFVFKRGACACWGTEGV